MMETILFSFILVLIIIWMMLGILYFYMRYVSPYDFIIKKNGKSDEDSKKKGATKKKDGQKGKGTIEQAEFVLIGKAVPLPRLSHKFPLFHHLKIRSRIIIILHRRTPKRRKK